MRTVTTLIRSLVSSCVAFVLFSQLLGIVAAIAAAVVVFHCSSKCLLEDDPEFVAILDEVVGYIIFTANAWEVGWALIEITVFAFGG